jgi:hypothetical protein
MISPVSHGPTGPTAYARPDCVNQSLENPCKPDCLRVRPDLWLSSRAVVYVVGPWSMWSGRRALRDRSIPMFETGPERSCLTRGSSSDGKGWVG